MGREGTTLQGRGQLSKVGHNSPGWRTGRGQLSKVSRAWIELECSGAEDGGRIGHVLQDPLRRKRGWDQQGRPFLVSKANEGIEIPSTTWRRTCSRTGAAKAVPPVEKREELVFLLNGQ